MKKIFKIGFTFLITLSISTFASCRQNVNHNSNDSIPLNSSESSTFGEYITVTDYEDVEQVENERLADQKQYFGIMGLSPSEGKLDTINTYYTQLESDLYNCFLFSYAYMSDAFLDEQMTKLFEKGKTAWFYIIDTVWVWGSSGYVIREDAYKRLYTLRERIVHKTWYDALLGFHMDEPLLAGMTRVDLIKGTKAIHDVFPEKRMWVNFAGFAFNEDIASSQERMTKEAGKYITDLSFDLYGEFSDTILNTWNNMVNMFEGENKYFWAIPMCMSYAGITTEDQAIEHLEAFYSLIKQTKGGCGIFLYTFTTFSWELEQIGNIGFGDLMVSESEFMTWKNKKKPWVMYYNRFYDENDNPINGGYKPWTNMLAKIQEISDLIETYNYNKGKKLTTTITIEDNQVFEYNGGPQYPIPEETYLPLTYQFRAVGEDIYTDEAPIEIGNYEAILEVKSSAFRTGKKVKVNFSIIESSKTLINVVDIIENYTTEKSTVAINRSDLMYSLDGVHYENYLQNQEIDVTNLVVLSEYGNCIYFKSMDKEPYIYRVWTLKERTWFDFESANTEQWSHFVKVANKKHSGTQSAYFAKERCTENGYYHVYCNTANIYDLQKGCSDISGTTLVRMWVYSEDEIRNLNIDISTSSWISCTTNETNFIPAKEWTQVTFDLTKMNAPAGFDLSKTIMFSIIPNGQHEFYIDDLTIVSF